MQLSEKSIINFLSLKFNPKKNPKLIGDDAAIIEKSNPKKQFVITIDTLAEDVHFLKKHPPFDIGKKLVSVTLSDIAAMCAIPKYILISLAIPKNIKNEWVNKLYSGINYQIKKYNCILIGGDTVRNSTIVLSSVGIGESILKKPIYRSGAKNTDYIYTTGSFGFSFETNHHLNFTPRLKEIAWLASKLKINSLTDASDGLYRSLEILSLDQNLGADLFLEKILIRNNYPISLVNLKHALFDGEDFELIFTTSKPIPKIILQSFYKKFKIHLSEIGRINNTKRINYFLNNKKIKICGTEFIHF